MRFHFELSRHDDLLDYRLSAVPSLKSNWAFRKQCFIKFKDLKATVVNKY